MTTDQAEMKIVAHAKAPVLYGRAQTIWDNHCFICHCLIGVGEKKSHQRFHEVMGETTLTARSMGEAHKMAELIETSFGARRATEHQLITWISSDGP